MKKTLKTVWALMLAAAALIPYLMYPAEAEEDPVMALRMRNAKTMSAWMNSNAVVLEDGTLAGYWREGWESFYELTDVVSVSASETGYAALKSDGTPVCDRDDVFSPEWRNLVDLEANCWPWGYIGITADGRVLTTYANTYESELEEVKTFTDVISAEACFFEIAFLHADGTVHAYSSANPATRDIVRTWTDVVQLAVSEHCVFGLRSDGTVLAAGILEGQEMLSEWTDIVYITAGSRDVYAIRRDGTLLTLSDKIGYYSEHTFSELQDIAMVAPYAAFAVNTRGEFVTLENSWAFYDEDYSWDRPPREFGESFLPRGQKIRMPRFFNMNG